ncbi:MAG TPA: CHAT domain-containing protein, partial [Candidatus Limnocylindrales bacterium]|nr:CHAT domain-containing protein [Candidatus Limnocylindrales bacterium]
MAGVFLAVFCWGAPPIAASQAANQAGTTISGKGLVVEQVEPQSAPDRAGIQPDDLLLSWTRGEAGGELASPFDLNWVAAEQSPRGPVILHGARGNNQRDWTLLPGRWNLVTHPAMAPDTAAKERHAHQLLEQKQYSQAAELFTELAQKAGRTAPQWFSSWVKMHAGFEFDHANQFGAADRFYSQAAGDCGGAGPEACRQIRVGWARAAADSGNWRTAESYFYSAIEQAEKSNSPLALAATCEAAGYTAMNQGNTVKAGELFSRAQGLVQREAPHSLAFAQVLLAQTMNAMNSEDYVSGEATAHEALALLQEVSPQSGEMVMALKFLRAIAYQRDDLFHAEEYARRAVAVAAKGMPGSDAHANALQMLALMLRERGNLTEAEKAAQRAFVIQTKLNPAGYGAASSLNTLGMIATGRKLWDQSEGYFRRALAMYEKLNPDGPFVVDTLRLLGLMYEEKPDLVQADETFRHALTLAEKLSPQGRYSGDLTRELGKIAAARGRNQEAERYYSESADILGRTAPGSMDQADTIARLARLKLGDQEFGRAEALYERALKEIEVAYRRLGGSNQVRAEFRAGLEGYYSDYIELLMRRRQTGRAFEVLELSRARTLLDLLASAHVDLRQGADARLLERAQKIQEEMTAKSARRSALLAGNASPEQLRVVEKEIGDLALQREEVEGRIRATSPQYVALTGGLQLSAATVQHDLLDPQTLLLEYTLGERRSYLLILSATSLQTFELPGRAKIEEAARRVYDLLTERNKTTSGESALQMQQRVARAESQFPAAAAVLSRLVLGPAAAQLENKRLLIVADGALQYIPFAMLPDPQRARAGAHPQPLVLAHEIVNLPSASVLASLRREEAQREPAPKAVAVIADPVFAETDPRVVAQRLEARQAFPRDSGEQESASREALTRSALDLGFSRGGRVALPRLRYSRQEAEAILALAPAGGSMKAVDFDASRATALSGALKQFRIVHFATHGLLNSEHPELSGLVLSLVDQRGRAEDGFFQLPDIYNLKLNADLVVLSACESGLGKEVHGEGLIGLTRGFMYAGASRVVASLWSVADAATAQLMTGFYRGMEKGGLSPAAALRAAQIEMLHQRRW